jgi:hypothetical protein
MSVPFALETRRAFDDLARQYEMNCLPSTDREVRYENDNVFMIINFDNGRSYELGVEVGRKKLAQPERPFSLAEILRLRDVTEAASIDGIMISDMNQLAVTLTRLARLTSQYAADFLMGSELSFAQVAKLRKRESEAYVLKGALREAINKSETAWAEQDYQTVIESLEPLEQHLSPAERKRLNYSRRRLSESPRNS